MKETRLGRLCIRGHDYEGTGKSLRYTGHSRACVICAREWQANSYKEHKEERLEGMAEQYYKNREARLEYQRRYYEKNKKEIYAKQKAKREAERRAKEWNVYDADCD